MHHNHKRRQKTYMMRHELALIKKTMQNTHTKTTCKNCSYECAYNCRRQQCAEQFRQSFLTSSNHHSSRHCLLKETGQTSCHNQYYRPSSGTGIPYSHFPTGSLQEFGTEMGIGGNGKQKHILADLSTQHRGRMDIDKPQTAQ